MDGREGSHLTLDQRVAAAYLNLVRCVPVQDLAIAYAVNMGRISEAVTAMQIAADNPLLVRKLFEEHIAKEKAKVEGKA